MAMPTKPYDYPAENQQFHAPKHIVTKSSQKNSSIEIIDRPPAEGTLGCITLSMLPSLGISLMRIFDDPKSVDNFSSSVITNLLYPKGIMSFPSRAEREVCWGAKDNFWKCLDDNNEQFELCTALRKQFESSCSSQWVKHFDRKRKYEKFKDEMEKKNWQDPLKVEN